MFSFFGHRIARRLLLAGTCLLFLAGVVLCCLRCWLPLSGHYRVRGTSESLLVVGTDAFQHQLSCQAAAFFDQMATSNRAVDPLVAGRIALFGSRAFAGVPGDTVPQTDLFQTLASGSDDESIQAAVEFLASFDSVESLLTEDKRFCITLENADSLPVWQGNPLDRLLLFRMDSLVSEDADQLLAVSALSPICFRAGLFLLFCTLGSFWGQDIVVLFTNGLLLLRLWFEQLGSRTVRLTGNEPDGEPVPIPIPVRTNDLLDALDSVRLLR